MDKVYLKYICFFIFFMFCDDSALAQDTIHKSDTKQFEFGKYYLITSIYGTTYRGPVLEESSSSIVILDKKMNTKHKLLKYDIKEVTVISNSRTYQAQRFDDNYYTNYYMISENALPFRKGSFNTTSHYFGLNNMNYSFSEHWGISMNLLVFLPASIGVKCSFKLSEDVYFGGNIYAYGVPSNNFQGYISPLFGSAARITKGDEIVNFTLGGGIMAVKNSNTNSPYRSKDPYSPAYYLNFAYANRFAKHMALNLEAFIFPQANASFGASSLNLTGVSFKWIRNPSDHWNFGCYAMYIGKFSNLSKNSQIIPLPYIGYSTFFN